MVVTIIMAILAAIVIPMATGSTDMEASAAATTIASDLQYAQNMAISFQSGANGAINGVKVVFATSNTPGAGSYKLINDDNKSSALINPMTAEAYNVVFTSAADMGDVCLTSTTFAQNTVEFDATGAPSNAGTVTVQAGTAVYQVSVAASTGKVTVTCVNP